MKTHITPTEHIDYALSVEKSVPKNRWQLYLDCMNGIPMSKRTNLMDIREGCILTGVYSHIINNQ